MSMRGMRERAKRHRKGSEENIEGVEGREVVCVSPLNF